MRYSSPHLRKSKHTPGRSFGENESVEKRRPELRVQWSEQSARRPSPLLLFVDVNLFVVVCNEGRGD